MSVRVVLECCGCDATAPGTDRLRMEFLSFSGRAHGFGAARMANTVQDVTPPGWIAYDPYTYMTYCPSCWTSILAGEPELTPDSARAARKESHGH